MFLLRSYSHHSLLNAVPKIPALVDDAIKKGYTSIAITDENTSSGFIEFYNYCQDKPIKAVLGFATSIPNDGSIHNDQKFSDVCVLAKNQNGYKQLLKLITLARTVNQKTTAFLTLDNLTGFLRETQDLFVVLSADNHEFYLALENGDKKNSEKIIDRYIEKIGVSNILVELSNNLPKINQLIVDICKEKNIKYLVSPAPRYLENSDEEAYKIVIAIREGKKLANIDLKRQMNLPSKNDLETIFKDFPEACQTTQIEDQIDIEIRTDYDKNVEGAFFPIFALPSEQTPAGRLTWESYTGMLAKFRSSKSKTDWQKQFPYEKLTELKIYCNDLEVELNLLHGYEEDYFKTKNPVKNYIQRLEYELDIIIQKGYPSYFLVFGDIMNFCRENSIVTNTRGSAAGSLVGYFTNINILDPLKYIIPFERFLNPLRPSPPDIDGDFADDKRDEVIQYITKKYGFDKVSQIITFGTMLPRAAVRDVGRVLGVSYTKCDKLSKLIPIAPQGKKTTFKWALETSQELQMVFEKDSDANRIINLAMKIEANYRHASAHAAGVIIAPTISSDYCALQWDSDRKMYVCQYDMGTAEKVGLVKLDILGIRNLAILGKSIEISQNRHKNKIDLLNIETNSKKTFDLLSAGRTIGTFQLSGVAMTNYLVELEPTKVEDLMAMVALYRPGPMASIPDYIERKRDSSLVKYLVPQMKNWMEASYGIFVYQEDLLLTAIELAGYDWGGADVLRKGMGKKIQSVIDQQHPIFVQGCQDHSGISREMAEHIWSLMVPFGAYGFNKAHSSSYGMVAYWTAYMKAIYTVEFMTALMSAEASNLDKIAIAVQECRLLGILVKPPDINTSFADFTIEDDKTIRYGLGSVKNLGSDVIKFMIKNREEEGGYKSLENFLQRMSSFSGFNKRSLEALILSGSLDTIGAKLLLENE
jgi:DNA polymerase III subunit alpha